MMNAAASAAGAFIEAPRTQRRIPATGRFHAASARPDTIKPTMSESLWAPAMKWMSTSGLQTPSQNARAGSLPSAAASIGTATAINTTPNTATNRSSMTVPNRL